MKVAFISQPFDDVNPDVQYSSLAIWTHAVATRLVAAGCEVVIYTKHDDRYPKVATANGIHYRRVPVWLDEKLNRPANVLERLLAYPTPKLPWYARRLHYFGYSWQIARDLRRQGCDIVHLYSFSQFVPVIKALNPQIKVVLHMQGEWLSQLDAQVIRRRLATTDLIVGCSDHITQRVQQGHPEYATRCVTVLNGVEIAKLPPTSLATDQLGGNSQRLLFVGRVSPEKGIHVLLQAMQQIVAACPAVQLDIVGPIGSLPYEYIVLVSDDEKVTGLSALYAKGIRRRDRYLAHLQASMTPAVASHVNFVGSVAHADVKAYYQRAALLINPSFSESFGISLVEAMAAKRPVVVSRVGGMPEIVIDGQTGLLVPPGDSNALAAAIITLLGDRAARQQMGAAGYQRAQACFSWDRIAQEMLQQYQRVLKTDA